ncbi:hypothetical protein BDV93DRAFT_420643, partial [Ceratobasidium sp. AG-I]
DLVCEVNLQHDCYHSGCKSDRLAPILEEREATSRTRAQVSHSNTTHFILNTQSLHNYEYIQ